MRWIFCFLIFPWTALADTGEVVRIPYEPLSRDLAEIIDFEGFPKQLSPGLNQDAPLVFEGAVIGERFRGQAVVPVEGYDRIAGTPDAPLALLPGPQNRNLSVTHIYFLTNQVQGLAEPGYPDRLAGGEGVVSILFEQDQRALGFRVSAEIRPKEPAPMGQMTVTFHARDGRVIDRLTVELEWGRNGYGFERPGGQQDIAGISIENRDPGGIAIDDIIFDLLRAGT